MDLYIKISIPSPRAPVFYGDRSCLPSLLKLVYSPWLMCWEQSNVIYEVLLPPEDWGRAVWPVPEQLKQTGSLQNALPGADELWGGGLIMSDPGLLAVSYRSLKSAPKSFFQVGVSGAAWQPSLDPLTESLAWPKPTAGGNTERATVSDSGQGSNPGSALLSRVTSTVSSRAQLPLLSI